MYRAHPQPYTLYTLLPPARGAPQAPQAARSAAAGGGQQVRKIKRHFRFRSFATNVEIRYKSRLTRAEPPTKTTEGRADSAPPGAPQAPQACGAPPQAADSRCAKLNAIFGSAVLALSTNFVVQIDLHLV